MVPWPTSEDCNSEKKKIISRINVIKNCLTLALWPPSSPTTHCLYRFSDGKKTSRFLFSIPSLWVIHRNLKQKQKKILVRAFFRKSHFCTFSCMNPGFGGRVMHIFSYSHIHNVSQEYFWSKKFHISCTGSKVPFGQFFNFSSCHLKSYTGSVSS